MVGDHSSHHIAFVNLESPMLGSINKGVAYTKGGRVPHVLPSRHLCLFRSQRTHAVVVFDLVDACSSA